jgi:hypothetical protein
MVLAIALWLGGCADDNQKWFGKPMNMFGNNLNYTYSSLGQTRTDRSLTANDLIDGNGACPNYVPPQAGPPPNPGEAAPADGSALLGGGVALGMSECDVVARLGQPTAVNLGQNANRTRNAILTYNTGPRPGVYRFEGGRLSEMDRVQVAPDAPPAKTTKKKAKADDKS